MDRRPTNAREGWQSTIEQQGLVYWRTELPDGGEISYWTEDAYYSLTEAEVFDMEATARLLLNDMLVAAGDFIIEHNMFHRLGIPGWAVERIKETWESEPPMLYGRFDFALGRDGFKLLEFNADTPTALLESAVVQWYWLTEKWGEGADQWNRLHEALVERWRELKPRMPGERVYLLHSSSENSGEDFMTVGYLAVTAREAGLNPEIMPIEQVGLNGVGFVDMEHRPIQTAFKLYPWEWLVHEKFADAAIERMGEGEGKTLWIEPIWKMLWSNKGILPVLWHLYPGHEALLPAYFEDEQGELVDPLGARISPEAEAALGTSVVRKPLLAREGANAQIVIDGRLAESGPDQDYGEEGFVVQKFTELDAGYGARPVLGVWVVDMEPAGMGIRESDGLITNNLSRFVPHSIES